MFIILFQPPPRPTHEAERCASVQLRNLKHLHYQDELR